MDNLLISTLVVAIAEIGDKTQLLALLLAARFRRPWPIIAGIFVATVLNHALAGWLGALIASQLTPNVLRSIVATTSCSPSGHPSASSCRRTHESMSI